VEDLGGGVKITGLGPVACRDCETPSARVHDRYRRPLQDLACAGRPVQVVLEVRRFICDNLACEVATFAEQVGGLTAKHQRRTVGLRGLLERVALALAGRAGSRLVTTASNCRPSPRMTSMTWSRSAARETSHGTATASGPMSSAAASSSSLRRPVR
jgi:transposase